MSLVLLQSACSDWCPGDDLKLIKLFYKTVLESFLPVHMSTGLFPTFSRQVSISTMWNINKYQSSCDMGEFVMDLLYSIEQSDGV